MYNIPNPPPTPDASYNTRIIEKVPNLRENTSHVLHNYRWKRNPPRVPIFYDRSFVSDCVAASLRVDHFAFLSFYHWNFVIVAFLLEWVKFLIVKKAKNYTAFICRVHIETNVLLSFSCSSAESPIVRTLWLLWLRTSFRAKSSVKVLNKTKQNVRNIKPMKPIFAASSYTTSNKETPNCRWEHKLNEHTRTTKDCIKEVI